jgi:L-ascorbate metabolism protein UlaG (beta-lactamase superfamily)
MNNFKTVRLATASAEMTDKNTTPMKWGRTEGYMVDTPEGEVYHGGKTVFCYEPHLFDKFVPGLLIAL